MPLQWPQVRRGLDPLKFTVRTAPGLLAKGKPWADYDKGAGSLVTAIRKFTSKSTKQRSGATSSAAK
jgi:bifunctional non-homologous end joining protein LigD